MRVLPFTKYSPCGNTTILVRESSLSPADRARVAAEIIFIDTDNYCRIGVFAVTRVIAHAVGDKTILLACRGNNFTAGTHAKCIHAAAAYML